MKRPTPRRSLCPACSKPHGRDQGWRYCRQCQRAYDRSRKRAVQRYCGRCRGPLQKGTTAWLCPACRRDYNQEKKWPRRPCTFCGEPSCLQSTRCGRCKYLADHGKMGKIRRAALVLRETERMETP